MPRLSSARTGDPGTSAAAPRKSSSVTNYMSNKQDYPSLRRGAVSDTLSASSVRPFRMKKEGSICGLTCTCCFHAKAKRKSQRICLNSPRSSAPCSASVSSGEGSSASSEPPADLPTAARSVSETTYAVAGLSSSSESLNEFGHVDVSEQLLEARSHLREGPLESLPLFTKTPGGHGHTSSGHNQQENTSPTTATTMKIVADQEPAHSSSGFTSIREFTRAHLDLDTVDSPQKKRMLAAARSLRLARAAIELRATEQKRTSPFAASSCLSPRSGSGYQLPAPVPLPGLLGVRRLGLSPIRIIPPSPLRSLPSHRSYNSDGYGMGPRSFPNTRPLPRSPTTPNAKLCDRLALSRRYQASSPLSSSSFEAGSLNYPQLTASPYPSYFLYDANPRPNSSAASLLSPSSGPPLSAKLPFIEQNLQKPISSILSNCDTLSNGSYESGQPMSPRGRTSLMARAELLMSPGASHPLPHSFNSLSSSNLPTSGWNIKPTTAPSSSAEYYAARSLGNVVFTPDTSCDVDEPQPIIDPVFMTTPRKRAGAGSTKHASLLPAKLPLSARLRHRHYLAKLAGRKSLSNKLSDMRSHTGQNGRSGPLYTSRYGSIAFENTVTEPPFDLPLSLEPFKPTSNKTPATTIIVSDTAIAKSAEPAAASTCEYRRRSRSCSPISEMPSVPSTQASFNDCPLSVSRKRSSSIDLRKESGQTTSKSPVYSSHDDTVQNIDLSHSTGTNSAQSQAQILVADPQNEPSPAARRARGRPRKRNTGTAITTSALPTGKDTTSTTVAASASLDRPQRIIRTRSTSRAASSAAASPAPQCRRSRRYSPEIVTPTPRHGSVNSNSASISKNGIGTTRTRGRGRPRRAQSQVPITTRRSLDSYQQLHTEELSVSTSRKRHQSQSCSATPKKQCTQPYEAERRSREAMRDFQRFRDEAVGTFDASLSTGERVSGNSGLIIDHDAAKMFAQARMMTIESDQNFSTTGHINFIKLGKYVIRTSYRGAYPTRYALADTLYVCECCFEYFFSQTSCSKHQARCQYLKIADAPGQEVYRDEVNHMSLFRIRGRAAGAELHHFCSSLCRLAMMWIGDKAVFTDLENFEFYVLSTNTDRFQPVGYFSKELLPIVNPRQQQNLSCLCVFPAYHRLGLGRMLIDFSYRITCMEGMQGGPERPLSDLGRQSYLSFWHETVVCVMDQLYRQGKRRATLQELCQMSGICEKDLLDEIPSLVQWKESKCGHEYYHLDGEVLALEAKKIRAKRDRLRVLDANFSPDFVESLRNSRLHTSSHHRSA